MAGTPTALSYRGVSAYAPFAVPAVASASSDKVVVEIMVAAAAVDDVDKSRDEGASSPS